MGALLQQLGPTYVKIGQMMASRSDILPVDWTTEFARLQSDAEPFPWKDAWIVLRSELGRPPEELFATIEEQPFAAASTAQVHRATLPDGTLVAVKIQRPRIVAKTKADLGVMQELAKTAESAVRARPPDRHPGDRRRVRARASSRSSTTGTRRTTRVGSRTAWPASSGSTSRIVYEDLSSSAC